MKPNGNQGDGVSGIVDLNEEGRGSIGGDCPTLSPLWGFLYNQVPNLQTCSK